MITKLIIEDTSTLSTKCGKFQFIGICKQRTRRVPFEIVSTNPHLKLFSKLYAIVINDTQITIEAK